jgi:ribose/xylose/arabinose/galactoside ABC-type transport system permease subunit
MSRPLNGFWMSLMAAAMIGIVQMYLLGILWGYISIYTPLHRWLLTLGLKGTALHIVVFLSDSLLNVIFCLPAAYAICRLKPPRLPVYLILAIVPGFIWQYRLFFTDTSLLKDWAIFVPGVLLALVPLPLAALLLRRVLVQQSRH